MSPQARSRAKSPSKSKAKPSAKPKPKTNGKTNGKGNGRPDTEKSVLVLQGGGALGSYQAGAYAALAARDYLPQWVAGMSIGAINAAIIVGNPPERRVERLREFWSRVSSNLLADPFIPDGHSRSVFNETAASLVAMFGAPGFFTPRLPPPLLLPSETDGIMSYYDTTPLKKTLEELVDFKLINKKEIRLSVGAVNIRNGNFKYFDNMEREIRPEHIMASGALPPGFPPVKIGEEYYWDGGLVSNTPLQYVLDAVPREDMLIFQIDLFSARGLMPNNLSEVAEREKDIRYSSRTRLNTDVFRREQKLRRAIHRLLEKLPDDFRDDSDVRTLKEWRDDTAVTIVHLIKRSRDYSTEWKDFEFSRASMEEHWEEGADDVRRTCEHPDWACRSKPREGVNVLDLTREDDPKAVPFRDILAAARRTSPTGEASKSPTRSH